MATLCPTCSRLNPLDATYCYYDGRQLSQQGLSGPLQVGTLPFPSPFCFSTGLVCTNFNQLALACDERWDEARALLADGTWASFFKTIGRNDLAVVAEEAAKETDLDIGLSQLVGKFPADSDAMRPPTVAVLSTEENLGTLTPGTDHLFEVEIANAGMLVLRGMVKTDCDWLSFGDRTGSALKIFQTRSRYTLPVRVLGNKLRAGLKPLEGEILIDTNGGVITLPVRADIPVRPFPSGTYANEALAGARSPRELAFKARAHPREAAVLFEQGAVKSWYASNGWTYPVKGSQVSGMGAVQQFFDALGLTKPPHLEIDTERLICKGKVGRRLTKLVTITTKEPRVVYAQAWSNQTWITLGRGISRDKTVTLPLQIDVPARPGETIHADVTVQGNGEQQFIVPVTLTVLAADPGADAEAEQLTGKRPLAWILAGVGVLLVLAAGFGLFVMRRGEGTPQIPPMVVIRGPASKNEAWWDSIPGTNLRDSVVASKEIAPQDQTVFDGIATKDDVKRYEAYEKLAEVLPKLLGVPRAKEPLGRLLTECCVFEPSMRCMTPLGQALMSQIPRDGSAFQPDEKGAEVKRALWSLQVASGAMTHKAIHPERVQRLAREFVKVFGSALEEKAPPAEFMAKTEKLVAERCYRNTLPTAKKSIEHALVMRALLIESFPQQLPLAVRGTVDIDLIAVGLSKGKKAWPKLEPILKTCLESGDFSLGVKIANLYGKTDPTAAQKMEVLLATQWKVIKDPKLTRAEKVQTIRNSLARAAATAKISPKTRVEWLQKLTTDTLSSVEATREKETALLQDLQDTVRLAHASTVACTLFHKDAGVERLEQFDTLVARIFYIDQTDQNKRPDKAGNPKRSAVKGRAVGDRPTSVSDILTTKNDPDKVWAGCFRKEYPYFLKAGQPYTITLSSRAFSPRLRVEHPETNVHAEDEDWRNSGIVSFSFTPAVDDDYQVIVSNRIRGKVGEYKLRVEEGLRSGRLPYGPRGFAPRMMPGVAPPKAAPKANSKKVKKLNPADIDALVKSKKSTERVAALNNLADSILDDLAPLPAQKIAKYLLTILTDDELEEVKPKLKSFVECRQLFLALADLVGDEREPIAQRQTEVIVGGVLARQLGFAEDNKWRLACRKVLVQRALDLTGSVMNGADQAAESLRYLYQEQGTAFGIEDSSFLTLTRPTQVLERIIEFVAANAAQRRPAAVDKEYLEQIDRHLQAARFVAENDLEHMVLLQGNWIKVLTLYVHVHAPDRDKDLAKIEQKSVLIDRQSSVDQLRAGEEKILRIWARAHNLKLTEVRQKLGSAPRSTGSSETIRR